MGWWDDPNYDSKKKEENESALPWDKQMCHHDWKAVVLIRTTVYNCIRCDVKKEDFEAWEKKRRGF
jgi:hypothetical protein